MINWVNRTFIVDLEVVESARSICEKLSNSGTGMFLTPLFNNQENITHYLSTGLVGENFILLAPIDNFSDQNEVIRIKEGEKETIKQIINSRGFEIEIEEIENTMNKFFVFNFHYLDCLNKLGLNLENLDS